MQSSVQNVAPRSGVSGLLIEIKKSFPTSKFTDEEYLSLRKRIQIWRVDFNSIAAMRGEYFRTLSPDEVSRANAYHTDLDRKRFILRRGFLRHRLGLFLGLPADAIRFSYTQYGKPILDYPQKTAVEFSLSHASEKAVFAFTQHRRIGIDLEKKRNDVDPLTLAKQFFSPFEYEALQALPAQQLNDAFFKCWTRKEAFIKATGKGLSLPLDQFEVNFSSNEKPRVLVTRGDLEPPERWNLIEIEVEPEYESALAVYGPLPELQFFDAV